MYVRRSAAVLAAVTVFGTVTPAFATDSTPSASPSVTLPSGLYGTGDPTYDGVWRQSLALLAQDTVDVKPAAKAVDWLTGQQCADGAFAPFRADVSKACGPKTPVDTNNTAAAVQALAALGGHGTATGKAVDWLKSVQNKDGGWGYMPGGASDANSTSVVIGALAAVGEKPADVREGGKSPYDALLALSLPCGDDDAGAFAFQPDKKGAPAANADATAAGVVGLLGKGLVAAAGKEAADTGKCLGGKNPTPADAALNGAVHLARDLSGTRYLKSVMPGAEDQPDYGNTADAVVALSAAGLTQRGREVLVWLERHHAAWAEQSGPAAYAQLIFAAHASGTDPRDFGGTDLVEQLNATGPAPRSGANGASGTASAAPSEEEKEKEDDGSPFGVWWYVGIFLVVGIGIGFLLSGRNKGK
ncbi:prenyltransferase/squalene oxidase repeat-containing protein [Streptomyces sp. AC550_RSS872]|uniref:prenyltransferase/squalene oxidase repeat-containing protein n=1 Tax=Streptomyces sp. AC550_RSS872 TaxID=2823689 RepID=UPI001C2652F5|nr:prenyltransferase/squalene oxidase repeat-containing protein [Streptomyces sp. AC550_RSS872]